MSCHQEPGATPLQDHIYSDREISDAVLLFCFYTRIVLIVLLDVWCILMNEHQQML